MKSCDIKKVLIDFERLSYKAILIDGRWGIGKTFQVKKYTKDYENRKKTELDLPNVYYVSIFGFKSIDEIHTKLYNQIHPIKSKLKNYGKTALKAVGIVSKTVSLIPNGGELVSEIIGNSLDLASEQIDDNSSEANVSKKKESSIVIFDDLERTQINYVELLGYFNQLILQGIRIVCLCDKGKIAKKNMKYFNEFKEKIFDRIYSIEMADKEIIDSFFPNRYLPNDIYKIFSENLRLVSKTANFFSEINSEIDDLKKSKNLEKINPDSLLLYCSLIVCGFNNVECIQKIELNEKNEEEQFDFTDSVIEENGLYGFEAKTLKKIIKFEETLVNELKIYPSDSLMIALTKVYAFNDYQLFDEYIIKEEKNTDIFDTSFFLLSTSSRKKTIEEMLKKLLETNLKIDDRIFTCFITVQQYINLFPTNYNEDTYIELFAKEILCNSSLEKHLEIMLITENKLMSSMLNKISNKVLEMRKKDLLNKLNKLCKKEDIDELDNVLSFIRKNEFCKVYNQHVELIPEINNFFQNNNWLLYDMSVDMTSNSWEWNKKIASFAYDFANLRSNLKTYLENRKLNSQNPDEIEKINTILKYYF